MPQLKYWDGSQWVDAVVGTPGNTGAQGVQGTQGPTGAVLSRGISGRFYNLDYVAVKGNSTLTTANRMYIFPFYVGAPTTINGFASASLGAANSLFRIGIYNDDSGKPGTLLNDYGTLDLSTSGSKVLSFSSITLNGLYWVACVDQGSGRANVTAYGSDSFSNPYIGVSDVYSTGRGAFYTVDSITGALPSTLVGTTLNISFVNGPMIWVRIA